MNEYRLKITQTTTYVVYAYGVDVAVAEETALEAMNENGRLLEGCEVDVVCEHVAPMSLIHGQWRVGGCGVGTEPFMYQIVPDEDGE